MQYRGVMAPRGLVLLCIASLFVLALFVVPAGAQQTADPIAGQTAFIEVGDDGIVTSIGPIAVADCTVNPGATIVIEDEDGTRVELVDDQNALITGEPESITIEGMGPNGTFGNLRPGFGTEGATDDGKVISSTGIVCGDLNGGGGGPDDHQYRVEGERVTVIVDTIPDKRILVDTGGPPVGTLLLGFGLVGLGILVLRRA